MFLFFFASLLSASNSIQIVCFSILLPAGSKLATRPKHQGVKWIFLKFWGKTVKMTKPWGAKRKLTLLTISEFSILFRDEVS
ncbi:hypothetical protein Hanom_Chr06g00478001 [Helianthus anomalus]